MNPKNIHWKVGPTPKAELCHPTSKIVIYQFYAGKVTIEILSPCTRPEPMYQNYWVNDRNQLWAPAQLESVHWDWWESFHKEEKC